MSKLIDLTGQKFGRLTVICRSENYIKSRESHATWNCVCDCGNTKNVRSYDLRSGKVKSCGCYHDECAKKRLLKHGGSNSKLYDVWKSMKRRCNSPNCKDYYNYGSKGIKVCAEWEKDFKAFYNWAIANGYKAGLSIDRINVHGNYEPLNCRWVDNFVQANNRSNNRKLEFNGETKTISEWSKVTGINIKTLMQRLNSGWDPERALTEKTFIGKNQTYRGTT